MNKKNKLILVTIIFISLCFQFIFSILKQVPDTDECHYISFAKSILKTKIPMLLDDCPYLIHPPLFSYLLALFFKIFGVHLFIGRFVSTLASVITIIFTYLIGKELKTENIGLLATFFLAINPFFLYYSHTIYIEMTLTAFLTCSIYYFILAEKYKQKRYFLLSGILLGLSLITKYTAIILLIAIFIYWLIKYKEKIIVKKETYIFILPILFFVFLWILFGLLINKELFIQQQLYLLNYFNKNSWHLPTWRTVSFWQYFKELCGIITPFFILIFIIEYLTEIIKIFRKKIIDYIFLLSIFILLTIIGLIKIEFKDVHFPIPILGIMSLYVSSYILFFLNTKTNIFIKWSCISFFIWSISPITILFNPFDKKIYDNLYIYGIKRDKNYRVYKKIGEYLNDYVKEKDVIFVESKTGIISFYIEKKNISISNLLYYSYEEAKEFIRKCNIVVKEEGTCRFTESQEEELWKYIKENFYLQETFYFEYIPLKFITDYKILKPGDKEKTVWIYFRK